MKRMLFSVLASAALAASAAAEAPNRWGAIAFNFETRGVGIGWGFDAEWKAKNHALARCGWKVPRYGTANNACKVYVTTNNSCAVFIADLTKKVWGYGKGYRTEAEARERALYECKAGGGDDCREYRNYAFVCSGEGGGKGDGPRATSSRPRPTGTSLQCWAACATAGSRMT